MLDDTMDQLKITMLSLKEFIQHIQKLLVVLPLTPLDTGQWRSSSQACVLVGWYFS